jgi:hypothetical protein
MDSNFKAQILREVQLLRLKIKCLIVDVVDNLTTDDPTKALSAAQGKVLKDLLDSISAGTTFNRVNNYSALPVASTVANQYYHVVNSQGTAWLPGWLGGTYYPRGFYYSDGTVWIYAGEVPYQATLGDVNAGTIQDQFVSPFTFNNANKWNTKQDTLVSGTNIKTINGASALGSGNLVVSAAPHVHTASDITDFDTEVSNNADVLANTNARHTHVINEIPTGLINGINNIYTSSFNFVPGTVEIKLNGLTQKIIDDYNTSGTNTIIFNISPTIGENIIINYHKL